MSYGASAFPPVWKNIIGYDKPSTIRPYEKRMNADELALSLRETISRGLVLYLPFVRFISHRPDTITKVFDRSPFGNHGTIHGAVWQTLPSGKSALSFDGVDDYVDCGNDESLNIADEITLMVWVKPDDYSDINVIVHKRCCDGRPYYSWVIRLLTDGGFRFSVSNGIKIFHAETSYNLGTTWHHVVGVFDGSKLRLFVNCVLKAEQDFSGNVALGDYPVEIGRWNGEAYYFNGTIGEVRIYNRALSEEEIKRLYELTRVFYGV